MRALYVLFGLVIACGGKDEAGGSGGGEVAEAPKPVLPRVETWKAPGNPKEIYDGIAELNKLKEAAKIANMDPPPQTVAARPLPPTFTDALATDVQMIAFMDLGKPKLEQKTITIEPVKQVLLLYTKLDPKHVRGLRGVANQTFVKSLSDKERDQLAQELVDHVKQAGFKGDDAIGDRQPGPMSDAAKAALGGGATAQSTPASGVTAAPAGDTPLYAGSYRTSEGGMTLKQKAADPTEVYGRYAKGSIKCKATGKTLACNWNEGGASLGRAKFTRDDAGNMRGTWGNGNAAAGGGAWNCTLLAAGAME